MKTGWSDAVERELGKRGLSPRAASLRVSTNPDLFRNVLRFRDKANPKRETLERMAQALQISLEELMALGSGGGSRAMAEPSEFRRLDSVRADPPPSRGIEVAILGTAAGSVIRHGVEGFHMETDNIIGYVRRPVSLEHVAEAYAIVITGDSMHPMHPAGEVRLVNPKRPTAIGDTVIVVTRHWDHDPGQAYIKVLKRRTQKAVVVEQFNPAATIEIPMEHVECIHYVLTQNDILGF